MGNIQIREKTFCGIYTCRLQLVVIRIFYFARVGWGSWRRTLIRGTYFCRIYTCRLIQVAMKLYKITGFTIFVKVGWRIGVKFWTFAGTGWPNQLSANKGEGRPNFGHFVIKKTLWPLFMDGVQVHQGYSHFEEAVYFLQFRSQKFLTLILR